VFHRQVKNRAILSESKAHQRVVCTDKERQSEYIENGPQCLRHIEDQSAQLSKVRLEENCESRMLTTRKGRKLDVSKNQRNREEAVGVPGA